MRNPFVEEGLGDEVGEEAEAGESNFEEFFFN